jgi:hypothetical protein
MRTVSVFIRRSRGLEDVDGFRDLAGVPGAGAEFAQDGPGLELGVGAFAGGAQLAWAELAAFWQAGLFRPR